MAFIFFMEITLNSLHFLVVIRVVVLMMEKVHQVCAYLWKWHLFMNSHKQKIVAQSTAKAEYVATASTTNQAIWWRKVSFDLGMSPKNATKLSVDNKSAISMAKNQVFHNKIKHINVK